MCNIPIYFCNIKMKHLQHTDKPSETLETYSCNIVDKRCSAVHRGVSHDGRFVVEVSEIRSDMVIQAPRHKI